MDANPTSRWSLPTAVWFLALATLVLPPLLAGLGDGDCEYHMEVRTIAAAQETWMRQSSDPDAWLVPSWNGEPRVNKPPLTVWINMLLWSDLDPATADVDTLVHRARLAAALLSFAALLSIAWLGRMAGDPEGGWLAALVAGTSLLFLRFVRMASYDTYLLASCTIAFSLCAGALFAAGTRCRAAAWLVGGVVTGLAVLVKGPLAYVFTLVPVAILATLGPSRRRDLPWLLGAAVLSAAVAIPWYLYVLNEVPAADRLMSREVTDAAARKSPPWYYLGLIGLVFPWTLWLLASFRSARSRPMAPLLRMGLVWFAVVFVALSLSGSKQQRYIVPILPAVGLLIAGGLRDLEARGVRPTRLLVAHGALLALASVLYGAFGLLQQDLVDWGALRHIEIDRVPPWVFPVIALALLAVARQIFHRRRLSDPRRAAFFTAVWMALAATPAMFGYATGPRSLFPQRPDVEAAARTIGDAPVFTVRYDGPADWKQEPDGKFLLYARRQAPNVRIEKTDRLPAGARLIVLDETNAPLARLREQGWRRMSGFRDGRNRRILLTRDASAP